MGVRTFEEKRYRKHTKPTWRQKVAGELIEKGKVLDLGCGDGRLLKQLKKGAVGTGVDLSPSAVKRCRAQKLNARVADFDGKRLPFKNKNFDYVVMLDVIEHLYFPKETLTEARRVGKKLIVAVPNFASASARLQVLIGKVPENNKPRRGHVQWITLSVIRKWLDEAGWEIEKLEGNYYLQRIPILNLFTRLLGKACPSLFTTAFLVVAK